MRYAVKRERISTSRFTGDGRAALQRSAIETKMFTRIYCEGVGSNAEGLQEFMRVIVASTLLLPWSSCGVRNIET